MSGYEPPASKSSKMSDEDAERSAGFLLHVWTRPAGDVVFAVADVSEFGSGWSEDRWLFPTVLMRGVMGEKWAVGGT